MPQRYIVDRAAVEQEVARRRAIQKRGYFAWFTRVLFVNVIIIYLAAFLGRWGAATRPISELPLWHAALIVGLPFLGALAISWFGTRSVFKPDAVDPDKVADKVLRDVQSLAGPGWPGRSLAFGLKLGLGVGIPIALLLAVLGPRMPLPGGSRWLGATIFVGLTLLWAIPLGFLLRWWSLVTYRRLLKRVDD